MRKQSQGALTTIAVHAIAELMSDGHRMLTGHEVSETECRISENRQADATSDRQDSLSCKCEWNDCLGHWTH